MREQRDRECEGRKETLHLSKSSNDITAPTVDNVVAWPYLVSVDWTVTVMALRHVKTLGAIAEVRTGVSFRSRIAPDPLGDVVVIQMKDLDESNRLHLDAATKIALDKVGTGHLLRAGDLLFRSRGRSNGAARVPEGIPRAIVSAPMLMLRPHGVLPEYLCWFINTPETQAQLASLAEGTSVQMISAEALKKLEVPLPSLSTQAVIAHTAELALREQALMAEIAARRKQLTTHILMRHARETKGEPRS